MREADSMIMNPEQMKVLIDTALGKIKADLAIVGGNLVNVYTGELLKGQSVAIKGKRIAFVGENAEHTIGPDTRVIDAAGKTLIPGLIDAHTHLIVYYTVDEFLKYAMKGGTTTIVTETMEPSFPFGYQGVQQSLEFIKDQPIKIFATVPSMVTLSPSIQAKAFQPKTVQKLFKHGHVVGLGETYWLPVIQGDKRVLELFAETLASGKKLEGHSAGARDNNLVAYSASGISSCHESTTAEEVLERLRLGLWVMIREGDVRKELEAIARIKDEKIDFRRLCFGSDGIGPLYIAKHGYMESVVQKAIDLGFDPIVAIQMATINAAEHFSLDSIIGGIAPGKCADIVIIPDLQTIQAELVISEGSIIAREGQILVPPRKFTYPKSARKSVRLTKKLKPADFSIHVEGGTSVTVRVIDMVTDLVTKEAQIAITPTNGVLEADVSKDILKIAIIDRTGQPGNMFTGFIRGFKMKRGAFASTGTWDLSGIIVVGANDDDMALAVNRLIELQGGIVICVGDKVLTELPLPIDGYISEQSREIMSQKAEDLQEKSAELGIPFPDAHLTLTTLTTAAIPFIRICESGLMDIRENKIVDLIP
jgi:adenine deaminase